MTRRRLALVALAATIAAAALDVALLRSFEFITWPSWRAPYAPQEAVVREWNERVRGRADAARRSSGVTLIIIDGLRVDALAEMPALRTLAKVGRQSSLRVEFPSFSRVGYATMLTGAPPRVHGFLSNHNKRPSPIDSVADLARRGGIRTRLMTSGHVWIPQMFPQAFEEVSKLVEGYPAAKKPYLDIIYIDEPDDAGHRFGGASPQYRAKAREVDGLVAGILSGIDLSRETAIVVSDHGHLDRGGHGGSEEVVMHVPLVEAGPGIAAGDDGRLEWVAGEIARVLGLPAPPPPPAPATSRGAIAAAAAGIVVLALASQALLRARLRAILAAVVAAGAFAALYALRHPFSFSCVNDARDIPRFAAEVYAIGLAGLLAGFTAGGFRRDFFPAALALAIACAAAAGGVSGPTAATALDHPQAAYLYDLALGFVASAGTASLLAAAFSFRRERLLSDT